MAARLTDYKKPTNEKFTTTEFKQNPALQDKVASWHFSEIQREINKLGDKAKGYKNGGLKAVAHLGGIGGMKSFVRSKDQYNPKEELGTSLLSYYDKCVNAG